MAPNTLTSTALVSQMQRQLEFALRNAFDVDFDFWDGTEGWRRCPETGHPQNEHRSPPEPALATLLNSARETGTPQFVQLDATRCLLAIATEPEGGGPVVATAEFSGVPGETLLRQAKLFAQLLIRQQNETRLHQVNRALTVQVTESLEEITLLRDMAAHLQLTDRAADPLKAVRTLLPRLSRNLKAEGLALVLLNNPPDDELEEEPVVRPSILWAGSQAFDDERCLEFIDALRKSKDAPTIDNQFQETQLSVDYPQVRELVLVEIAASVTYGWLLAINHRQPSLQVTRGWVTSESRFGTVEATLLKSAASILATHFHNVELLRQKDGLITEIVLALVNAIEARDPYTFGHSERVALFAERLAREAGLDRDTCERIYLSGLLHDVGKIALSDATLQKKGKLTDVERKEVCGHPAAGWAILSNLEHLQGVLPGVLHHHEQYDGSGYPNGLAGEEIPLEGRIMAICDAYDAMTSNRIYRDGMSNDKALSLLAEGAGSQWDPTLVQTFFDIMPDILEIRAAYRPRQRNDLHAAR